MSVLAACFSWFVRRLCGRPIAFAGAGVVHAVEVLSCFGFLAEVGPFGDGHLHFEGSFAGFDSGGEIAAGGAGLLVVFVEPLERFEHVAPGGFGGSFGAVGVEDGGAGAAESCRLERGREGAGAVDGRAGFDAAFEHHYARQRVLGFRAHAVDHPRADAGTAEAGPAVLEPVETAVWVKPSWFMGRTIASLSACFWRFGKRATMTSLLVDAMDWVIAENGREGSPDCKRLDTNRIAVMSISYGGFRLTPTRPGGPPNGREFGKAVKMFLGAQCGLCPAAGLHVSRKGFP